MNEVIPETRVMTPLLRTALITGAVASVVSLVLMYSDFEFSLKKASTLLLTPAGTPLFAASYIDLNTDMITPVSVEGQGTAMVIDVAPGKERDFYLIAQDGEVTNVFAVDRDYPERGLQQITNTQTLKTALSHDPASGAIVFSSFDTNTESSTIFALWEGTTTPTLLAEGSNPVLLSGGSHVVYEREAQLFVVSTGGRTSSELLTIPQDGSYAVDGQGLRAALYDPASGNITQYDLKNFITANAITSEKVTIRGPVRLILQNEDVSYVLLSEQGIFIPSRQEQNKTRLIPDTARFSNALISVK